VRDVTASEPTRVSCGDIAQTGPASKIIRAV
jgi:hypothetical protein